MLGGQWSSRPVDPRPTINFVRHHPVRVALEQNSLGIRKARVSFCGMNTNAKVRHGQGHVGARAVPRSSDEDGRSEWLSGALRPWLSW